MPDFQLHHGDCLDVLPTLGQVDAIVTDPPYGMKWNTDSTRFTGGSIARGEGRKDWGDVAEDDRPFDPAPWLKFRRVVLWGANHYAASLPVGTSLIWIKKADHLFGTFLSDAEVGWMKGGYGVYCFRKQFPPPSRMHEGGGKVLHPTQKPIALMEWCFRKLKLEPGMTVLDPYMGSGTTGIAALRHGLNFIGIEKKPEHYETASRRIESERAKTPLIADAG